MRQLKFCLTLFVTFTEIRITKLKINPFPTARCTMSPHPWTVRHKSHFRIGLDPRTFINKIIHILTHTRASVINMKRFVQLPVRFINNVTQKRQLWSNGARGSDNNYFLFLRKLHCYDVTCFRVRKKNCTPVAVALRRKRTLRSVGFINTLRWGRRKVRSLSTRDF